MKYDTLSMLEQLVASVRDDLEFLGISTADYYQMAGDLPVVCFTAGNQSMALARLRFQVKDGQAVCHVTTPNACAKAKGIHYKNEMEAFSRDVCKAVVNQMLRRRAALGV